jgi:hypothetical protein
MAHTHGISAGAPRSTSKIIGSVVTGTCCCAVALALRSGGMRLFTRFRASPQELLNPTLLLPPHVVTDTHFPTTVSAGLSLDSKQCTAPEFMAKERHGIHGVSNSESG